MKKIIKRKIALGLITTSGIIAICGTALIACSSNRKNHAIDEFTQSHTYKATIAQELSAAEQKFDNQDFSLEALSAYYDEVNQIYSKEHTEELVKNDTGTLGKAYADSQNAFSAGILTLMGAGAAFIAGNMFSIEVVTGKKKEDETLNK